MTILEIDWIVFDLGGVVINVDFNNFFSALPAVATERVLAHRAQIVQMFSQYENRSGGMLPDELFRDLRELLALPLEDQQIISAINAILGEEKQDVCGAIKKLAQNYQIACLSNTNHIHWEALTTRYQVFRFFRIQMASQLLGYSKPDQRIYQKAVEELSTVPERILFFDDKLENVEAAQRSGWNARQFVDFSGFVADLKAAGVKLD